ncbi:MAG: ATP-binding cassette domain-containing protein [Gemmatimonadota bacterium]|nr:MAG: ATP-binding cassette domain-containing protein [Gemmatimonadota bacterium]
MLEALGIEHAYGGRAVLSVDALELERGTVTAVVGPNGSGKSTLLRILSFVERPRAGAILLEGGLVVGRRERLAARRRVTMVEQHPYLFPGDVRHNLLYALALHGVRGAVAAQRADAALERLQVAHLAQRPARDLSAGETQRVAIARALSLEPSVLLLDEPAGIIDRAATAQLYRVLDEERARGATLCFASHQLEDAYRWSDRLVALAEGRVSRVTPENLFRADVPGGSGAKTVRVGPLHVQVVTEKAGPATIAIPADEIVVSREPLHSSARNEFPGRVTRIGDDGRGGITLMVDVGVELAARITPRALDELGIGLGTEVVLAVKAMAVRVF